VLAELGAASLAELALSGTTVAERLLGVRLVHRTGGDVTPALADPVTCMARSAHDLLVRTPDAGDDALRRLAGGHGPGGLWALAVLAARGHRPRTVPRFDLPGVPTDVREAVLREYAPRQRDTDPRWLIEAALLPPADEADHLGRAVATLAAIGVRPQPPVSAGDEHRQGRGTYHSIGTDAGEVVVSTLGPFVRHRGAGGRTVRRCPAGGRIPADRRRAPRSAVRGAARLLLRSL
jgi:hypothetical protein